MWAVRKKDEKLIAHRQKEMAEPKLTFVKPKLTKHGKLEEVTRQFFWRLQFQSNAGVEKRASRNKWGQSYSYALGDLVLELRLDDGPATSVS